MAILETLGVFQNKLETYTTDIINPVLVQSTLGSTSDVLNIIPLLYINPTFSQNLKSIYSDDTIVNFGKLSHNPTFTGSPNAIQIATSGYYEYNFDGTSEKFDFPFSDQQIKNFIFSCFFKPNTVSSSEGVIVDIVGEVSNLFVKQLDDKIQILLDTSLLYEFDLTIDASTRYLLNISIADNVLYASIADTDNIEILDDIIIGSFLPNNSKNQYYTALALASESDSPSTYFAGVITNIIFSDKGVNFNKTPQIFSSNQILIDNNMPLVTASVNQVNSPLGNAILKTLNTPEYGFDVRETENWTTISNGSPQLLDTYNVLLNNGGSPTVWHRASASVNRNLFTDTNTLATQTIDLPLGFYDFWFETGTGSITVTAGTGAGTGLGSVGAGKNSAGTFEVTTAGTFNFTVSGTVNNAMLQHSKSGGLGANNLIYQAVTGTPTIKSLGIGTELSEGTFENGSVFNMIERTTDNINYTFNGSDIQTINLNTDNFALGTTYHIVFDSDTFASFPLLVGREHEDISFVTSGQISYTSGGNQVISTGSFVTGTISIAAVVVNNLDITFYKNGVNIGVVSLPSRMTPSSNIVIGGYAGTRFTGKVFEVIKQNSVLNSTQVTNIYNNLNLLYNI